MTSDDDELHEGQVLASKYRVERVLGSGGMGVVLSALHIELEQRVAIKVLKRSLAESESISERFRREARAAVKIRSPHGARVLDVGTTEDGLPYMVMEYLDGHDLSAELEQRGQLPFEEAASYVMQAADAICDAHDENIIHRDIKPANLFLSQRGGYSAVKVLDFGISKSLHDTASGSPGLTHTQALIGSPMYMSPEQLDSPRTVDERTDIWSLGIVLYELVTGQPPFTGDGIAGLIKKIVAESPIPLAQVGVDAPPEFEEIILRCLAKKRDDRYGSVRELMAALAPFAKLAPHSTSMVNSVFGGKPLTPAGIVTPAGSGITSRGITSRVGTTRVAGASATGPGPERRSPSANGSITPLGQSRTHAEPAKKRAWPWVVGGLGAAAAVALLLVIRPGQGEIESPAPEPSVEGPIGAAISDLEVSKAASPGESAEPAAEDEPKAAGTESAPAKPEPSVGVAAPSVSVGAIPTVEPVEVPEPKKPSGARPAPRPKRPPKPPVEPAPAPKPPPGISDFGGRH